jgi:uncharacterized protein YkwD
MRALRRRLVPVLLVVGLLMPAAVPVAASTPDELAAAAEATLAALNAERTKRGLVALRADSRLMAMAQERSDYQASTGQMSHKHIDGTNVFDLIASRGITWYGAGEIVAWNTWPGFGDSGAVAIKGWLGSSTHRSILLSSGYNYIGLAVATDEAGGRYWTGIFLKGPDRTKPWAKYESASKRVVDSTRYRVTLRWSGADRKLQVLTAGIRYYEVQRRRAGGTWRSYGTTSNKYMTVTWKRGTSYEIRIRARDRAGNWSPWHTVPAIRT